jgi:hypothetical protein
MHATRFPRGPRTRGRADLDGDHRPDEVVVATYGLVDVELGDGDRVASQILRPDLTLRVQALADLYGDGHREVVTATTTAGSGAYRVDDSVASVVSYHDGTLHLLHLPNGDPVLLSFDVGRGDEFAGIRCHGGGHVTQLVVLLQGPDRLRVTATDYALRGDVAYPSHARSIDVAGDQSDALRLSTTHCVGMATDGWTD